MADRYVIHGPLPSALREVKSKRTQFLVAGLMCLQYLNDIERRWLYGNKISAREGGPWQSTQNKKFELSFLVNDPIMSAAVSSIVFDDIFTISDIDKEGRKFDRGPIFPVQSLDEMKMFTQTRHFLS